MLRSWFITVLTGVLVGVLQITPILADEAASVQIPVIVNLPKASFVTLVIEDEQGNHVRNLIAEEKLVAGPNKVLWDGRTDSGGLAHAGTYHWRGLYRDELNLEYQFSVYNAGAKVPWFTTSVQTGTDTGWLSDHNPPLSVCAAGDQIFIGTITSEAGQDAMAVDLNGKKLWGISHPYGVGAKDYAYDGQNIYAGGEGQWAGANGYIFKIDPKTYAHEKLWDHKGFIGLRGLAARDGRLYISSDEDDKILVLDIAAKKIVKEIPLANPGGIAFAPDGRLLAISGQNVVVLREDGSTTAVVKDHLTHANRIAIAPDGTIFVSDGPTSWYRNDNAEHNALYGTEDVRFKGDNQVKVFDAQGKYLRAIGTPGGRKPGPYDPQAMRCPVGVAVDSKGRVWVAEWDMLPKRISVWTPEGKLVQEFIGAHKYGGGGALDPGDKTQMIYDGMLFKLDWEKGDWKLSDTIVDIMNVDEEKSHVIGGYANWPSRIVRYKGEQYFVSGNDDIGGMGGGTVWKRKGSSFVALSHIGPFSLFQNGKVDKSHYLYSRLIEVMGEKAPGGSATDIGGPVGQWNQFTSFLMLWTDQNGDGVVQPAEVNFSEKPHYWMLNPYIGPDLSVYLRNPAHRGVTNIWRLPASTFNAAGAPVYDINKLEVVREDIPNKATTSSTLEADSAGRLFVNASAIYGIDPKARTMWAYPNPWPIEGGGAPRPKSGLVIAGYSVRGVAEVGGEVGTIFAINSNFGQWYLFTHDGLFLSTIFGDVRTSPYWGTHFKEAKRGMLANGVSHGQESFFGSMTKTSDGNVYIVAGHPHASIIKISNLDSIKRIQGTVKVSPDEVLRAAKAEETAALEKRKAEASPSKVLPSSESVIASAYHPGHSLDVVAGRFPHTQANYAYFLGYDKDNLWIRATMPHFVNKGTDWQRLFTTGDAAVVELGLDATADPARSTPAPGDVRIVFAPFQGKPVAVLYRYRVPGATKPIVFQSAAGKTGVDEVRQIEDAQIKVEPYESTGGKTLAVVAKIPWKALTDDSSKLMEQFKTGVRGDVGFIIGDATGTSAFERINWANPARGVVGDVAWQARLTPNLWGTFKIP